LNQITKAEHVLYDAVGIYRWMCANDWILAEKLSDKDRERLSK